MSKFQIPKKSMSVSFGICDLKIWNLTFCDLKIWNFYEKHITKIICL
jgi:hypothetical protein